MVQVVTSALAVQVPSVLPSVDCEDAVTVVVVIA
jgi:hypothetical protein